MRAAILSYHTCPLATLGGKDTGGMNVYVHELTTHLGRLGVHADVFTRSQDEHVPHVLHDLGYGNRVVHIPAGPEVPLPKSELAGYLPQFVEGIKRFAADKDIHYDLIHSHYWMSGIAAGTLKETWHVPVIQMFHTLGLMKNSIARSPEEREGAYRIDGERGVIHIADRIIAATPAEVSQLQSLYHASPSRITIIPPGVDTSRFYPIPTDEAKNAIGIPPGDCMVLFVGRIEPLKGVDTLIRAMALLRQQDITAPCPVYLAIIGGDPDASPEQMTTEMKRLQDLSCELQVKNLVIFLGKQSQDTLPYFYSAAEVLVMPSHYESFGMVALEAMACGTPVIASQVGGLPFLVQDGITGYIIPDGDPQVLCDRLRHLLSEPDLRSRLGEQAAAYTAQYAWEKITRQVIEVYRSVIKGGCIEIF